MKNITLVLITAACILLIWTAPTSAHFGCIIPSNDIVNNKDDKDITLYVKFFHPMEGEYMNMEKPKQFGVYFNGKKNDLTDNLKEKKTNDCTTWEAVYKVKRPGDYTFYLEPKPYWEPAEDCFIVHYTKTCIDAFGLEEGWDEELDLETEIIPLTRPYGLWTGNIFSGIVKVDGEPVPYAEVEVEYYNKEGKIVPPKDAYITQVIKADKNGVFSYAMPKSGWWGFAALNEASWKLKGPDGEEKPVEIGAVYWVQTRDMK